MNIKLNVDENTFNKVGYIHVFELLTRFLNEAGMINMSEAKAFAALPHFLTDPVETDLCTNLSSGSLRGGVMCWPEAISTCFVRMKPEPQCTTR